MERLTDDEIDQLYLIADTHSGGITMSRDRARKMLTELRERRAADLTAEEMEALLDALDFAFKHTDETPTVKSARDKLLASGGGK